MIAGPESNECGSGTEGSSKVRVKFRFLRLGGTLSIFFLLHIRFWQMTMPAL